MLTEKDLFICRSICNIFTKENAASTKTYLFSL